MEELPYSIYIDKRPIRIAFLVGPQSGLGLFDDIFEYNQNKWGGRFNPIILTDGKSITTEWWKFLRDYDPDIIKSFVELDEAVQKKIQIFLSPYSVKVSTEDSPYIGVSENPISIVPTKDNIRKVSGGFVRDSYKLIIFNFTKSTPDIIKKFIRRNFGMLEYSENTLLYIKEGLEGCDKKVYEITDFKSLNDTFLELGEFRNLYTFPIQICSLPNSAKPVGYNMDNEKFTVIVGNSQKELSYFWDRSLMTPRWMRTRITQLWLPEELASNDVIKPGLQKWLNKYVHSTGNDNNKGLHFVSFTLNDESLRKITESLGKEVWKPKKFTLFSEPQIPDVSARSSFFHVKQGLDLHRAYSQEEHIVINEPSVIEESVGGEDWIADIYIQFRPERFTNIIGNSYWWRLPQKNNLVSELGIFNKQGRINSAGIFSVMMRRSSDFFPDENTLIIKLPEDKSVLWSLICGKSYDCYKNDKSFLSKPFYNMTTSNEGRYLAGVINLFSGLSSASGFFEKRYWRNIFDVMSHRNVSGYRESIFNKIKKNINQYGKSFRKDEDIEWLTTEFLTFLKEYDSKDEKLPFEYFTKEGKRETGIFNKARSSNDVIPFEEEGLRETISDLIDANVLLVGVMPMCPHCGYKIWYHIDEVKQKVKCSGCSYIFSMSAGEKLFYRLNSFVRFVVRTRGTVPVLLVLGQLLFETRSSFLYYVNLDLFKNKADRERWGELDIVCIKDGKFILGEVKQHVGLFTKKDFEKMAEVATLLKPDLLLFSSLDLEPNSMVKKNIEILRKQLSNLEIEVKWYPLSRYIHKHSPVR